LVGADFRVYEVIPDGNNFVDFSRPVEERNQPLADGSFGDHVYYKKYGVFAQATKLFLQDKLKLTGSLRFDHNLEFSPKINPRVAAVYTVSQNHNFRVSYQNGFRFPALFEALSFVNNGNVRRVGGLSYINEGLGYLDNSFSLESVNKFNAAVNASVTNGAALEDAALANRDLLVKTELSPTRPERINSFEVGYKSSLFDNSLIVDVDVYTNAYDGFLGQVEVSVPTTGNVGTDEAVIDMLAANRARQTRYRVFTNAKNTYNNYGVALGLTYNFFKSFTVAGNVNYNDITENRQADIFVNAFNTPAWFSNISFGNRAVTKRLGFNVVWRWQDEFLWQSPLANGIIPSYNTFDAQVTYRVPALYATIKGGGANIFNQRYIQYAAGPNIGALYYIALTLDGLFAK
jgi:outer membrane receptor protein involved in Fe transport